MKQWNKLGLMNKQNELSCVFLEKAQTAGTDQNLLFVAAIFLVAILFFSLWRFSHMLYLSSDGLILLYFLLCGALELLLCLKSKKHKGSDSLSVLMGNYRKYYLHISAIIFLGEGLEVWTRGFIKYDVIVAFACRIH